MFGYFNKINILKLGKSIMKKKLIITSIVLLQVSSMAESTLKKTDPEVIAKCDKNGDTHIKGREYLCYLDLKKEKAEEELETSKEELGKAEEELGKAEAEGKRLDEDIAKLENKILGHTEGK